MAIAVDLGGAGALVTGGTRGLGRAIAIALGRAGARVFVTHRWGSVEDDELSEAFAARGLAAPVAIEADASDAEATREVMRTIREQAGTLHTVVSNVAFSKVCRNLADLKKNALDLSLGYSAWPVVDLVQAAREVLGASPRYVIGVSSDGGQVCHSAYDMAGASKAVLETLCRYLALRLKPEGTRVNVIRPGFMDTASSRATFGDGAVDAMRERFPGLFLDPDRVAGTCVALASGLMDAVTGQVIVIDEGWSLVSPLAYLTGQGVPGAFPEAGAGTAAAAGAGAAGTVAAAGTATPAGSSAEAGRA